MNNSSSVQYSVPGNTEYSVTANMTGSGLLSLLLLSQAAAILQQQTSQDPVKNIKVFTEDVKNIEASLARTIPEMPVPDLIRYWGYPVGGGGRWREKEEKKR